MSSITYKQIIEPRSEQVSEIFDGLNSFGLEEVGGEEPARVAVVCEDQKRRVIGGAIGHSILQRFYLTQLWFFRRASFKWFGVGIAGANGSDRKQKQLSRHRRRHSLIRSCFVL
jgi:hypothetical protein